MSHLAVGRADAPDAWAPVVACPHQYRDERTAVPAASSLAAGLRAGGGALAALREADPAMLNQRLAERELLVATDVDNPPGARRAGEQIANRFAAGLRETFSPDGPARD